jgi:hypothetical protein
MTSEDCYTNEILKFRERWEGFLRIADVCSLKFVVKGSRRFCEKVDGWKDRVHID